MSASSGRIGPPQRRMAKKNQREREQELRGGGSGDRPGRGQWENSQQEDGDREQVHPKQRFRADIDLNVHRKRVTDQLGAGRRGEDDQGQISGFEPTSEKQRENHLSDQQGY